MTSTVSLDVQSGFMDVGAAQDVVVPHLADMLNQRRTGGEGSMLATCCMDIPGVLHRVGARRR